MTIVPCNKEAFVIVLIGFLAIAYILYLQDKIEELRSKRK